MARSQGMKTHVAFASVKASEAAGGQASFVGYASVFDVIDEYGEVVRKGAFTRTLAELAAADRPLAVYYAHQMNASPFGAVGIVTTAEEDEHGLRIEADLFVDDNPEAKYLHQMMLKGVIGEMSFAFITVDGGYAKAEGDEVWEIRDVDLLEVSVCPVGVNRSALIESVKARLGVGPNAKAASDVVSELRSTVADAISAFSTAFAAALEKATTALEDDEAPDGSDDESDESDDAEAPAEDAQKALELRARVAAAIAPTGGKDHR